MTDAVPPREVEGTGREILDTGLVKLYPPTEKKKYYRLSYYVRGKRRQPSVGKDLEAAKAEARAAHVRLLADQGSMEMPVSYLYDRWMEAHPEPVWSYKTRQEAAYIWTFAEPHIGHIRIMDWDTRLTLRAMADADQPDANGKPRRQGYRVRKRLLAMVKWAIATQTADGLVVEKVIPPKTVADKKKDGVRYIALNQAPDAAQSLAVARAAVEVRKHASKHARDTIPPEWYVYPVLVGAFCGLRLGEVLALQGKHITAKRILVRRQVVEQGGQVFKPPKYNKFRDVPIPVNVDGYPLRQWLNDRAAEVGPEGLIFPAPEGGVWWRGSFYKSLWDPARQRAGWPEGEEWDFHGLRHNYCRWLLDEKKAPITWVSAAAGHEQVSTTMTMYVHPTEAGMVALENLLEE